MRGTLKFLLTFIVGIALIWLGFWWYAESRLQSGFTDWADRQATKGWKISYDSIQRGTSVMDAAITIHNLGLTTPPGPKGEEATIGLPTLTLRIAAFDPLVFHTDLPGKIAVSVGDNISGVVNIASSSISEDLDPNTLFKPTAYPFRGADFTLNNVDILASAGSLLVLHIDKIASHGELNLKAGADHTAVYSTDSIDGIAISPLLARLASVPFDGKLTHLDMSLKLSGPLPANLPDLMNQISADASDLRAQQKLIMPAIHQWASQGGTGSAALNLILGPSTVHADGALKFDANLQPTGTANLTADHLDQLTAALTNSYPSLQNDIAQAEAESSQYLSNTDQGGQTLTMHLAYGKPGIVINGQKAADMPPLDWNAAENPVAPAPVQPVAPLPQAPPAPGDGSGANAPTQTNP